MIITFAVRFLGHTNTRPLRLKVMCSAADKAKTYGYYECENIDGTFSSQNAEVNAVRKFIADVLSTEQPWMIIDADSVRQLPTPIHNGDTLFMVQTMDKREVQYMKQVSAGE